MRIVIVGAVGQAVAAASSARHELVAVARSKEGQWGNLASKTPIKQLLDRNGPSGEVIDARAFAA